MTFLLMVIPVILFGCYLYRAGFKDGVDSQKSNSCIFKADGHGPRNNPKKSTGAR